MLVQLFGVGLLSANVEVREDFQWRLFFDSDSDSDMRVIVSVVHVCMPLFSTKMFILYWVLCVEYNIS